MGPRADRCSAPPLLTHRPSRPPRGRGGAPGPCAPGARGGGARRAAGGPGRAGVGGARRGRRLGRVPISPPRLRRGTAALRPARVEQGRDRAAFAPRRREPLALSPRAPGPLTEGRGRGRAVTAAVPTPRRDPRACAGRTRGRWVHTHTHTRATHTRAQAHTRAHARARGRDEEAWSGVWLNRGS